MLNKKNKETGFSLIELLAAIFFVSVAMSGLLFAISKSMGDIENSSLRLRAIYLAQEGVEIVRNIRDTNWLEGVSWDQGLNSGSWEADYQTQELTDTYDGDSLLIDGGFYNYTSGTSTPFKREIIIEKPESDQIKVTVVVRWKAKGSHQVSAQEILYNWRQ